MSAIETAGRYGAAAATGDLAALAATLSPDLVWHQPGSNPLSGDHVGPDAVVTHLGRFLELSGGTFSLSTETMLDAGALVATTVRFTAARPGRADLDQRGVDIFRVENDLIAEIWLISEDQDDEDAFWS